MSSLPTISGMAHNPTSKSCCCCVVEHIYPPVTGQRQTLTFHYQDYFGIGGIRTCLGVSDDPMFLWISSSSCPLNLLLVQSHQAEIIIVKCCVCQFAAPQTTVYFVIGFCSFAQKLLTLKHAFREAVSHVYFCQRNAFIP